jgi:predicted TIM-barrel fold metal-dependent hydrolase
MSCDRFRDRLAEYHEEALEPPERRAVSDHLKECAMCRSDLSDLERLSRTLNSIPEAYPRIEALRRGRSTWGSHLALAAALLLMAIGFGYVVREPRPQAFPGQDPAPAPRPLEWMDNLDKALAEAKSRGTAVLAVVVDSGKESSEMMAELGAQRNRVEGFTRVKIAAESPTAAKLQARAPSVLILEPVALEFGPPKQDAALAAKLQAMKFTFSFSDTPLSEVLDFLRAASGLTFVADRSAGDVTQRGCTINVKDISIEAFLGFLLKPLDLEHRAEEGAVVIYGKGGAPEKIRGILGRLGAAEDPPSRPSARADEVRRKLDEMKVDLKFREEPLDNVVDFMREYSGLKFVLDFKAEAPKITLKARQLSLSDAMKRILESAGLTYRIEDEGIIRIFKPSPPPKASIRKGALEKLLAQPSPTEAERRQAQDDIRALGSEKAADRDAAWSRLRDRMPKIRPLLRTALRDATDPEVHDRLRRLLELEK